jgi:hypothetical protein
MTTIDTLTSEQVDALENEAAAAGDLEMVELCRTVTSHWNRTVVQQTANQSALRKVLAAINHAEAQR